MAVSDIVARAKLVCAGANDALYRIVAKPEDSGSDDHDEGEEERILDQVLAIVLPPQIEKGSEHS